MKAFIKSAQFKSQNEYADYAGPSGQVENRILLRRGIDAHLEVGIELEAGDKLEGSHDMIVSALVTTCMSNNNECGHRFGDMVVLKDKYWTYSDARETIDRWKAMGLTFYVQMESDQV